MALTESDAELEGHYIGDRASPETRAHAHSGLVYAFWHEWNDPGSAPSDRFSGILNRRYELPEADDVTYHQAAKHAVQSAELGLVSGIVLDFGLQFSVVSDGMRQVEVKPFASLLKAVEDHHRRRQEEDEKRDTKVANSAKAYICAVQECLVQGLQKKALMACGGPCLPAVKPHYCSKECQKKVS